MRYEIDFLLKLRPPPESTPKPAGLNPPERVDIIWDGKVRVRKKRARRLVVFVRAARGLRKNLVAMLIFVLYVLCYIHMREGFF